MILDNTGLIILAAALSETMIFGFFLNDRGIKVVNWIIKRFTTKDFFIWIMPIFFFVSHILVYGFTLDNIMLTWTFTLTFHILMVVYFTNIDRTDMINRLRKRIKESTIRVSEPHYFNLEWMLCKQ